MEEQEGKNVHIYINVSTGSKVSSIAGTLACMIWKGTPYYVHIDYNDKKDPADDLPDEDVTIIDERSSTKESRVMLFLQRREKVH